jgi:hypothetical protein
MPARSTGGVYKIASSTFCGEYRHRGAKSVGEALLWAPLAAAAGHRPRPDLEAGGAAAQVAAGVLGEQEPPQRGDDRRVQLHEEPNI